jgi:hypothetical protein
MNEIEQLIHLLLKVTCRLEDYCNNGIVVPLEPNIVEDRITDAEARIESWKKKIEKDRKVIKQIKDYIKRRKELKSN